MPSNVNLRTFNLNTLPVLWEILQQGSISKAAEKLNVTQPALSAALKQLRGQFDDELIFRSGRRMKLTPKAEALIAPLEGALRAVQDVLAEMPSESSEAGRAFAVAGSDHQMEKFGLPMMSLLEFHKIDTVPVFMSIAPNSAKKLVNGDLDCIILPKLVILDHHLKSAETEFLRSAPLYSEDVVAIIRSGDRDKVGELSVQEFLNLPHVDFVVDPARNLSMQQAFLAANGMQHNVVARFASYHAILPVVESTSCISLVPASLASSAMKRYDIRAFNPPVEFPRFDWLLIWHQRSENFPRTVQMREVLLKIAAGET